MNDWDDDWDTIFSVATPPPDLVEPDKTTWDSFDFAVEEGEVPATKKAPEADEVLSGTGQLGLPKSVDQPTEKGASGGDSAQVAAKSPADKEQTVCVASEPGQNGAGSCELNNQVPDMIGVSATANAEPYGEAINGSLRTGYGSDIPEAFMASGVLGNDAGEDPDIEFFNRLGDDFQHDPSSSVPQIVEPAESNFGQSHYPASLQEPLEQPLNCAPDSSGLESPGCNQLSHVDNSYPVLQNRSMNSGDYSHQRRHASCISFQQDCQPEFVTPVALETVDGAAFFDMLGDIADGTTTSNVLENHAPEENINPYQPNSVIDACRLPAPYVPDASPTNPIDETTNNTKGFPSHFGGSAYDGGHQIFESPSSNPGVAKQHNVGPYAPYSSESAPYSHPQYSYVNPNSIYHEANGYTSHPEAVDPNGIPCMLPGVDSQNDVQGNYLSEAGAEPNGSVLHQAMHNGSIWEENSGYETFFQPGVTAHSSSVAAGAHYGTNHANSNVSYPRHIHGRPPCPVINFGIGGKVVVMMPKVVGMNSLSGPIEVHSLKSLPSILSRRQREAGLDTRHGLLDPTRTALEHFPGPLGSSTNKDKLISYITDRMESCPQQEPDHADSVGLKTLWGTMKLMVKHPGFVVDRTGKTFPTANEEFVEMLSTCGAWDSSFAKRGYSDGLNHGKGNAYELEAVVQQVQRLSSVGNVPEALKVAKSGGLWDIALVMAQFLGQKAFSETAAEMAKQRLLSDSPLKTLVQLMAGKHDTPIVTQGSQHQKLDQADGIMVSEVPCVASAEGEVFDGWQGHLAMLAANRGTSRREVACCLGDRLVKDGRKVCAGHLFYLMGGLSPQQIDDKNDCRFSLLGWDHQTCAFPSAASYQCTEILEWATGAANPSVGKMVAFQPYKLLYAWTLAEYGYMSEAADYCELVLEAIRSLGNRMPKSLLLCATSAKELLDRIRQYAAAHNVTLKRSATLFESFGRILDKGINKLIGVGEGHLPDETLSRKSSVSDGRTPSEVVSSYMRTPSQASFDSSRNIQEDYRQRLSPRPPLASYPHYSYQQQVDPSSQWSTTPSPRGPYMPQRKSFSSQGLDYYTGNGIAHSANPQHILAHSPNPEGTANANKGGWLRMLWGGGSQPKTSHECDSSKKQISNVSGKGQFYTGAWGSAGSSAAGEMPPTLDSWRNESSEGHGSQGRLSPTSSNPRSGYGSGIDAGTYSGTLSATSTPKIQASQPNLQGFYSPQAHEQTGPTLKKLHCSTV